MAVSSVPRSPQVLDRYVILEEIASGGMATVHLGRLVGAAGFARPVAIKRLHAHYARDPEFASMLIDEARLASRVLHPNVVATLDVVSEGPELFLVMEYVPGAALSTLLDAVRAQGKRVPADVVVSIMIGVLSGLHAAHEATTERGEPLGIVHRDVSPHNVLVGFDGVPRVHDFGIAKAVGRVQTTREGQLKGKLRYMAPEQLRGEDVKRQTDIYSAAVVLWETLTGERLFTADNDAALFGKVLEGTVPPPSQLVPDLPPALDDIVLRALDREPSRRFETAREMALALEDVLRPASASEVGAHAESVLGTEVAQRARRAADASDPLVGDDAPTLPQGEDLRTETGLRALPAGLLVGDAVPPSSKLKKLAPPAGWSGDRDAKTRTETVQRVVPFALPPPPSPDDASSTTRALSASVPPPRRSFGLTTIVATSALAVGVLIAGAVSMSSAAGQESPRLLQPATLGARELIQSVPRPASEIQLGDVPVEGKASPVADKSGRPTPSRARASARPKPPKKPDCKQLYYTDSTGIRRVKRDCL